MSRHIIPRLDWSSILEDEESDQPVGAVVDQQPRDEKPPQEEPPTESQDITPDEEKADAGAPEVPGIDLETDLQELAKPMTGVEGGDDPEVIGYACANPEPIEMPETERMEERNINVRETPRLVAYCTCPDQGEGKPAI